jgi:hypothetical protein
MSPQILHTAKYIELGGVANAGYFAEAGNSFKYLEDTYCRVITVLLRAPVSRLLKA